MRDATLVGHSTGGGKVVRYIGRHGTKRVAKAVLVADLRRLSAIEMRHRDEVLGLPGVVGIDTQASEKGSGNGVIMVYVTEATPELRAQITSLLEGAPVMVVATPGFKAR